VDCTKVPAFVLSLMSYLRSIDCT